MVNSSSSELPQLDILIPTHNRCEVMAHALDLWARQPEVRSGRARLVVVDDGSIDGTPTMLEAESQQNRIPRLTLLRNEIPKGPASARNIGIQALIAPHVFITGDDIFPPRNFLSRLLDWIEDHPEPEAAVLGPVQWPRRLYPTRFMKWLEGKGQNFFFHYEELSTEQPIPSEYFYTCNVTVNTKRLQDSGGFDEQFPYASHEDLELGYRLGQQGMQLWYNPSLCAYHWHPLTLQQAADRVERMGRSAEGYWKVANDKPPFWKKVGRRVLTGVGALPGVRACKSLIIQRVSHPDKDYPLGWFVLMHLCFWIGCADGVPGGKNQAKDCKPDQAC